MYTSHRPKIDRVPAALASAATVGLIGWVLVSGLTVSRAVQAIAPLISVAFTTPPPSKPEPPRPRPKPMERSAAKDAASAPNIRNKATAIVAPLVRPIKPPPVVAAPAPGPGDVANNGAATRAGIGQGANGTGNGRGGGGKGGDGTGDGGVPPEQIAGRLRVADLPHDLAERGIGERVGIKYYVNVDGHVSDCRVTDSSGSAELDALTCRLIEERFRFRPSLDESGRPARAIIVETHSWSIDRSAMEYGY